MKIGGIWVLLPCAVLFLLGVGVGRRSQTFRPVPFPDTVLRVDTVRDTVPVPRNVYVTRVDTVWIAADALVPLAAETEGPGDTVPAPTSCPAGQGAGGEAAGRDSLRLLLPVERRIYRTNEYRAVVEGWWPSLVEMEVYPRTRTVTRYMTRETVRKTRWGIGVQVGYGIGPGAGRCSLYVGVGVQYALVRW